MENKLKEIALRIRELRQITGLTPAEMAAKTGVDENEYELLELGLSDFSFTFIYKCAQVFGVDVTDILKGSSPTLSSFSINKKGDGLPILRRKGFNYLNLAPLFKNKVAEPFVVTAKYDPAEHERPIKLSTHEGQEFDYVLEGTLKIDLGGNEVFLFPGDSIYYDSSIPHAMYGVEKDCRFIAVVLK